MISRKIFGSPDDWLTPDNMNRLKICLSSSFLDVKHFLYSQRPDVMSAIEKSDRNLLTAFISQLRARNPFIRIESLTEFLICLKGFYTDSTKHQQLSRPNLPFIDCRLNGLPIVGLIDTGAQYSIISRKVIEMCHILHLIDERYKTRAIGVGEQNIIGKIHSAIIEISGFQVNISLMVIDTFHSNYFLIGQDFLIAHKCIVYCADGTVFFKDLRLLVKTKSLPEFT